MGLNLFADLTEQEFMAKYTGLKKPKEKKRVSNIVRKSSYPTAIDWEKVGAVTPVRNQGHCASCWTFSSVGAMEGLHFIRKYVLESFSEQEIVDCSRSYGVYGC
jgi:C1A family cysteine protease